MPALICAWREGICPWPACSTWPMTTCSTCSGSTPARSSAAPIASPPSSVASQRGEAAAHLADRGARAAEDHGLGHGGARLLCRSWLRMGSGNGDRRAAGGPDIVPAHADIRNRPGRTHSDADTIAIGVFDGEGPPPDAPAEVGELLASGEARRSFKSLALTHAEGKRWLVVGLGAPTDFSAERARVAAAVACARAREISTRTLCWELPAGATRRPAGIAAALVEGTILGDYRFDSHKSTPAGADADEDGPPKHLERLIVAAPTGSRRRSPRRRCWRGGQSRARPAEPARQRPHADGARRVREGARARSRGRVGAGRGARRDRRPRHGRVRGGRPGLRRGAGADHDQV